MFKLNFLKVIDASIYYLILVLIFFLPLFFLPFYLGPPLFSMDKAVFLRILIEILTALTILRIVVARKIKFFIKKNDFIVALIFMAFFFVFAFVFSTNHFYSFWDAYLRSQSFFTYIHYFLFFIILALSLDSRNKVEKTIFTVMLSCFFVSLLGIAQWFGYDFFRLQDAPKIFGRVGSSLGQPVFLSNLIVLSIFLSIYFLIKANSLFVRFFYILVFISSFFSLIFTYTRASWLAFILTFFLSILVLIFTNKKLKKKAILFFLSTTFALLIFIILGFKFFPDSYFFVRISSIKDVNLGSIAVRMQTWSAGLDIILKRPWSGFGLENLHNEMLKKYNPNKAIFEKIGSVSDRMHSEPLDMLFAGGFVLFWVWILFLYYVFRQGILFLKKKNDWLIFAILAGLLAYHISISFSFSVITTNVYFWLFVGLIFLIRNDFQEKEFLDFEYNINLKRIFILLFLCVFVVASYFIVFNVNIVLAEKYFRQAKFDFKAGNYSLMYENYHRASKLNPRERYHDYFLSKDSREVLGIVDSEKFREVTLVYLEDLLDKYDESDEYWNLVIRSNVFASLAKYRGEEYYDLAEGTLRHFLELYPNSPEAYQRLGVFYAGSGRYEKSVIIYKKALEMLPDVGESIFLTGYFEQKQHINNFKEQIYNDLAYCYYNLEDYESLIDANKEIIKIRPRRSDSYSKLIEIYKERGEMDEVNFWAERGHRLTNNKKYLNFKK